MPIRDRARWAAFTLAVALLLPAGANAQNAYITNSGDNTVSVIDTATNAVTATIPVGIGPWGVAVTPDGTKAYVTNSGDSTVSVIDTTTNTVVATIPVGNIPIGVAVTPDGTKAYVVNQFGQTVSVIDTATNIVVATIPVADNRYPLGVAVTPDGTKAYVDSGNAVSVIDTATNAVTATIPVVFGTWGLAFTPDGTKAFITDGGSSNGIPSTVSVIDTATNTVVATIPDGFYEIGVAVTPDATKAYVASFYTTDLKGNGNVSVIDTATNTVVATILVGFNPYGVAVTPDATKVYVANNSDNTVSVIDTATNIVVATIPVGNRPIAFGKFIGGPSYGSPPVALNETATTTANTPVTIDLTEGASGHPTSAALVGTPVGGTVTGFPVTTVTFTPTTGFTGSASFQFTLTNASGMSNVATATITVTGPPTAANETATTAANTPVSIDLSKGASGNPTSAVIVSAPAHGTLSAHSGTQVTYTPNACFIGTDSFTFTLANTYGTSNAATATITVTGPPTAANETATTVENIPVSIDLAAGACGNPTSAALVGTPTGGTVAGFPGTTVTFTPTAGFSGTASFQFTLANAFGTSNAATTTITVIGAAPNFKLTASAYCNTSPPTAPAVKLSWTAQGGTKFYDLYRNAALYSQNIAQASFDNDANVTAGSVYTYFVVAHGFAGDVESNQLSVSVPNNICSPAMLPDLIVQNLQLSSRRIEAGSNTVVKFTIHNRGAGSAAPSITHIRLGKSSSNVTVNDPLLLSLSTPAIAQHGDKTKGDSVDVFEEVTLPNNQAAGPYYLWVILDSASSAGQGQANEQNDKAVLPVFVTNSQGPDLVVRNLNLDPSKIAPGGITSVSFSIANQGSRTASLSTTKVFLSTSNSVVSPTDLLLGSINMPAIAPGQVLSKSTLLTIPTQQLVGIYYLWIVLDANNSAGQSLAAKANDKSYVQLALASDSAPVPLSIVNALSDTIKALRITPNLTPDTLPDIADTIKQVADSWKDAGDVLIFLKTTDTLYSSFEFIKNSDPSLKQDMESLEQRLLADEAKKVKQLAILTGTDIANLAIDYIIDHFIGDRAHDKSGLPLLHSYAHTNIYLAAAKLLGGPETLLWSQAWDQGILIWKESAGLDSDMFDYVDRLRSSGAEDIMVYSDVINFRSQHTSAGDVLANARAASIASSDALNWDQVYALSREPSFNINSTKRPLAAWRIIQLLVYAREAELLNRQNPRAAAEEYISQVKSYVNLPVWLGWVVSGLDLKAFANAVAHQYHLESWVNL